MHQFDALREHAIQAIFDNRVGLAATHLHDDPGAGDHGGNSGRQLARRLGIAIFIEVLHADGTFSSSSWFICSRNSKTR